MLTITPKISNKNANLFLYICITVNTMFRWQDIEMTRTFKYIITNELKKKKKKSTLKRKTRNSVENT